MPEIKESMDECGKFHKLNTADKIESLVYERKYYRIENSILAKFMFDTDMIQIRFFNGTLVNFNYF